MKASQFVELLRKVIREEVRSVVKEELKAIKPIISETKKSTPPSSQQPVKKRTTPIVTMDGAIGDLLRETADSMHNNPWPDMNDGPLTSDQAPSFGLANLVSEQPQPNFSNDPTTAFIKDYSSILKKAEQHAENYRGV
jgi:hypothetical protein